MKPKMLAIFSMALLLSTASFAQGFHLGLKGGANMDKIQGESFNEGYQQGYHFGGFAELNFSKKVGIQPEVIWNQTNTTTSQKFSDLYDDGLKELKGVKLNYLSIPILLNISPSRLLTFQLGPQFGILLNKDQGLFENGKQAFKSGDFSMLGGLQLNLGGFKIGGRYRIGLANINDIDNQDQWKNQGFQVYAGFRIL